MPPRLRPPAPPCFFAYPPPRSFSMREKSQKPPTKNPFPLSLTLPLKRKTHRKASENFLSLFKGGKKTKTLSPPLGKKFIWKNPNKTTTKPRGPPLYLGGGFSAYCKFLYKVLGPPQTPSNKRTISKHLENFPFPPGKVFKSLITCPRRVF